MIKAMMGMGAVALVAGSMAAPALSEGRFGKLRERIAERRADKAESGAIAGPGDYPYTLRHGGVERQYRIHVPRGWRKGMPMPVVLALHGGGGSANYMAEDRKYGLITASEQKGFIAVFPNGISPLPNGMMATWNAGNCCGQARDKDIDDVGFLREVTARVIAQTGGDAKRVYAIGMSNGAMMSYRLACDAPDMLKGIMAVAGTDNTKTCTPKRPVSVLHVHARDDDHVPFNGGFGTSPFGQNAITSYVSVPATIAKWTALNRTEATSRRVLTVPGAACDLYAAKPGGAPVQLCITESGGHSWPGGGAERGKTPSSAISANDVMWDFFSRLG